METVQFLLASYGLTFLLCDAGILSRPRTALRRVSVLDSLLSCYFCTGFWAALVVYPMLYFESALLTVFSPEPRLWLIWMAYGLAGAAFAYGLNAVIEAAESAHYALSVYTGKFEEVVRRVRDADGEPSPPEEDEDDGA